MQIIADLQLHSKYSRAVSPEMVIPKMYEWNLKKGIGLLATGDWTHPIWRRELKVNLDELGNGLLKIKPEVLKQIQKGMLKQVQHDGSVNDPSFLLSGEVSCIYSHNGKTRRNHILMFAPSFDVVDKISNELVKRGCNISSDGRPIIGLTSQEMCEVAWSVSEDVLVIPAHAWTPWFSLYGSMSGYDSLTECFGQYSDRIYAIETGLSSDPSMNWRIKELDTRTLISCSDSHSGPKLMREATIFEIPKNHQLNFKSISDSLKNYQRDLKLPHIAATVEFYPEEGKYHYSGHRACNIRWSPEEVKQKGTICPVCGRTITIGVLERIEKLASRSVKDLQIYQKPLGNLTIKATYSKKYPNRAPYLSLVPLMEIVAESFGVNSYSIKVRAEYDKIVESFGGEFNVLVKTPKEKIAAISNEKLAVGVENVRSGNIVIIPGYDGVFGTVKVWNEGKKNTQEAEINKKEQMSMF